MPIPVAYTHTCDIYHSPNGPPLDPDVAEAQLNLRPDFAIGQERGDRSSSAALTWTHIGLFDHSTDLRDGYSGGGTFATNDTIYIPDKDGTAFYVMFIEILEFSGGLYQRVYLDRQTPTWPTDNL